MNNLPLNKILEFHYANAHSLEIKIALGDGYVLNKSELAFAIRKLAIKYGYSFTDSNFSFANTLPVISLAYFLRDKKITFTDNISVLEELNKTVGDFVNSNHLLKIGFPANSVLHESAHCIAHYHLFNNRDPFELFDLEDDVTVIFKFLIAESYSQTAEVLNFKYFLHGEATYIDLFMLKFNTFVNVKRAFVQAILQIEKRIDADATYLLIMLIFFCHNLKKRTISQAEWEIITEILEKKLSVQKQVDWCEIFDLSLPIREFIFSLGHDFINFTTPLFFKNLGYSGDYAQTLQNKISLELFLTKDSIIDKSKQMIFELNSML